jgi:two-component system invasion response regulator UvrY
MTRILAGDPHSIVRAGIRSVLSSCPGLRVAGEARDCAELLRLARTVVCDVVIAEIAGNSNVRFDFVGQLCLARPLAAVLVFTTLPEAVYGMPALRAGAAGYLTKDCTTDQLIEAVQTVASGRKYVSRSLAETLAEKLGRAGTGRPHETLSGRELQVFRMLAEGRSVGQVAKEISLSVKTVSTYRSRILEKTNLSNNAQLMRYALIQNLI